MSADTTIGVSFDKIEPFRVAQKKAIEDAAKAAGVKVDFANADKDAQRQASQVDTIVSDKYFAIVAIPWDIEAAVLNLAVTSITAGIPFVSMVRRRPRHSRP